MYVSWRTMYARAGLGPIDLGRIHQIGNQLADQLVGIWIPQHALDLPTQFRNLLRNAALNAQTLVQHAWTLDYKISRRGHTSRSNITLSELSSALIKHLNPSKSTSRPCKEVQSHRLDSTSMRPREEACPDSGLLAESHGTDQLWVSCTVRVLVEIPQIDTSVLGSVVATRKGDERHNLYCKHRSLQSAE